MLGVFSQNVFGYFASFHTKFAATWGSWIRCTSNSPMWTSVWTVALTFTHFCNITSYFIVHSRSTYTLEKSKRKRWKQQQRKSAGVERFHWYLGKHFSWSKTLGNETQFKQISFAIYLRLPELCLFFAEMHVTAEFWIMSRPF